MDMSAEQQIALLRQILAATPGITLRRAMERLDRMIMSERLKEPMTVERAIEKMKAIASGSGMSIVTAGPVRGWMADWEIRNGK